MKSRKNESENRRHMGNAKALEWMGNGGGKKLFLVCSVALAAWAGKAFGNPAHLIEEPAVPTLEGMPIPHPFAADKIAVEVVGNLRGISAFSSPFLPPELIQTGFDCPGFAEKGDLVWEWREIESIHRPRREKDKIPWRCRKRNGEIKEVFGQWGGHGLNGLVWVHPQTTHVWGWWGTGEPPRDIEHGFSSAWPWKRVETPVMSRNPETGETNVPATEVAYIDRNGNGIVMWWDYGDRGDSGGWSEEMLEGFQAMPCELEDVAVGTREQAEAQARQLAADRGFDMADIRCETQLDRVACTVPGFCEYGDSVWDIRFVRPAEGNAPTECRMVCLELLVRTVTGETYCLLGPLDQVGKWECSGSPSP
jgi:hypothetical protein